jgi:hypothetical protein
MASNCCLEWRLQRVWAGNDIFLFHRGTNTLEALKRTFFSASVPSKNDALPCPLDDGPAKSLTGVRSEAGWMHLELSGVSITLTGHHTTFSMRRKTQQEEVNEPYLE